MTKDGPPQLEYPTVVQRPAGLGAGKETANEDYRLGFSPEPSRNCHGRYRNRRRNDAAGDPRGRGGEEVLRSADRRGGGGRGEQRQHGLVRALTRPAGA